MNTEFNGWTTPRDYGSGSNSADELSTWSNGLNIWDRNIGRNTAPNSVNALNPGNLNGEKAGPSSPVEIPSWLKDSNAELKNYYGELDSERNELNKWLSEINHFEAIRERNKANDYTSRVWDWWVKKYRHDRTIYDDAVKGEASILESPWTSTARSVLNDLNSVIKYIDVLPEEIDRKKDRLKYLGNTLDSIKHATILNNSKYTSEMNALKKLGITNPRYLLRGGAMSSPASYNLPQFINWKNGRQDNRDKSGKDIADIFEKLLMLLASNAVGKI